VVVLREPFQDGLDFLRWIASSEETRAIPRLVLASDAAEADLQALGERNLLPLPGFVRDAITATRLLANTSPGADEGNEGELSGSLSDYGLYYVMRTMMGLRRSGIVTLERANRKGEIRFAEGEMDAAQVGSLQGQAALHQLLLWEEAMLEIKFRGVARRGQSFPRGEDLLQETERFLRDFAHATKNLGHVQSLLVHDTERTALNMDGIPSEVVPVLRLFDGQRTLGDVVEDSPFRVFDTLRIVTRLLDMGAIRRKAIEKPSTVATASVRRTRIEDWVSRGPDPRGQDGGARAHPEGEAEQRTGSPNRRKHNRRDRSTAELGTLASREKPGAAPGPPGTVPPPSDIPAPPVTVPLPPLVVPPPVVTSPPPASPVPVPLVGSGALETSPGDKSGEMRATGEFRATKREIPAAAPDVPSVVIDLDPGAHAAGTPAPVPVPAAPPPAAAPAAPTTGPITSGVLGARPAEVEVRSPVPAPAAGGGPSIQLDPRLAAQIDAFEMATSPPTPQPVVTAAPPPASPAPAQAAAPAGPVVSFVRSPTPPPIAVPPPAPVADPAPAPTAAAAAPAGAPRRSGPTPIDPGAPVRSTRPSGEFNALEADFFAREADLYKHDTHDSFDDLEGGGPPGARRPRR
jgi:hypothetical protein